MTSPVYFGNRISSDYVEGPTPTTKREGRRAYGSSLGRALDSRNLARVCRATKRDEYLALHQRAMTWWGERAIVNVDQPIGDAFVAMLEAERYRIVEVVEVVTKRYRVPGHGDQRAEHEVVIEARRVSVRSAARRTARPGRRS